MLPVGVQQEFHRAGALIVDGTGGPNGGLAHLFPQSRCQAPCRSLFDELLVAPLHGAVPVTQMDHIAVPVSQHLKFNMPGSQNQLLQIHLVVSEAGLGFRLGLRVSGGQNLGVVAAADTPAAAAGTGLEQHRIAHGLRCGQGLFHRGNRTVGTGGYRHTGGPHQIAGGRLGAGFADRVAGGTDKGQPRSGAGVGKVGVFRQKSIAGVDAVASGSQGCSEQSGLVEITFRGLSRTDAH